MPEHWFWPRTKDTIVILAECDKNCDNQQCPYIHITLKYWWCNSCERYHAENEFCDWWYIC